MSSATDHGIADAPTCFSTPAPALAHRMLWQALVDIADTEDLGEGPYGHRWIVPILGGVFIGGEGYEDLRGVVLPGGADRQLLRADGVKELDAVYEMRCHSGELLSIRNRVIIDADRKPERYALSRIEVTAPAGRFAWLNRRIILGSLQPMRPARAAVLIRGWEVDFAG
ncbi:MAG: DUF3237 domain-containing protein [Burkholderiaceae bacterium]|nr:DUF3237 domain-containing protein [Burkholderiaceae bacterium]